MNKKKGSAMILAILLLAFFMALSLNMWFISQKKAQRAGDKIIGNSVLTDIDGSSTLGYYEFYLATEYMTKGFVRTAIYTVPTTTAIYTSGSAFTTTIQGIWLENEKQYFGSYLDTSGGAFNYNALLREDTIVSNKLSERSWEITGGGIAKELWEATDWTVQESFGGYKIKSISVAGTDVTGSALFISALSQTTTKEAISQYEKDLTLGTNTSTAAIKNKVTNYEILVRRKSSLKKTTTGSIDIISDEIEEIIVTKQ